MFGKHVSYHDLTVKVIWVFTSIGSAIIIGIFDCLTGNFPIDFLYLVPIFLAAWYVNEYLGAFVCAICGLSMVVGNQIFPGNGTVRGGEWNLITEVMFLMAINFTIAAFKKKYDRTMCLANKDFLTGALNRNGFFPIAEHEINMSLRYNRALTIAYMDIDNFKMINDTLGHNTGDVLLCTVVKTIQENIRASDTLARLGGDEFVLLFTETAEGNARKFLEKLMQKLSIAMIRNGWRVTFSLGVMTYSSPPLSVDDMINAADLKMYSEKLRSKNMMPQTIITDHLIYREDMSCRKLDNKNILFGFDSLLD
jgi:diguanylate cyclase (GGDEF)-like protein